MHRTQLSLMMNAPISGISTLVVPPKGKSAPDQSILALLGMHENWPFLNAQDGSKSAIECSLKV
jgi:hypothetical protein